MTFRTIPAAEWIAQQPQHVQDAGEARGRVLIAEYLRAHPEVVLPSGVETPIADPLAERSD